MKIHFDMLKNESFQKRLLLLFVILTVIVLSSLDSSFMFLKYYTCILICDILNTGTNKKILEELLLVDLEKMLGRDLDAVFL